MEFDKIQKIICRQLTVPEKAVSPETSFTEDLGADSLDVFQIISDAEQQFSVEIPYEYKLKIKTAEDILINITNFSKSGGKNNAYFSEL